MDMSLETIGSNGNLVLIFDQQYIFGECMSIILPTLVSVHFLVSPFYFVETPNLLPLSRFHEFNNETVLQIHHKSQKYSFLQ